MDEIWKPIEEFDGNYLCSNLGRIKSTYRKKRILKPKVDKDGYLEYCLRKDGQNVYRRGHRLVAETFISNPLSLPVVNHLNNIPEDNRVENLEWSTVANNTRHAYSNHILTKGKCASQLTSEEFKLIISMYDEGYKYSQIIKAVSLSCRSDYIGEILSGRKLSELSGITKDLRRKNVRQICDCIPPTGTTDSIYAAER